MNKVLVLLLIMLSVKVSYSQQWTLKDSGTGLIQDNGSDKAPKIIERGNRWNMKHLEENGAMEGKYRGRQLFASWIQGPETKEFTDNKGNPVWLFRYSISNPEGYVLESDTSRFQQSGYAFFSFKAEPHADGVWKVEWFLVNRQTLSEILIATNIFESVTTTSGKKNTFNLKAVP